MFSQDRQPESSSNVARLPIELPEKAENLNSVHVGELDRRFGPFLKDFYNTHLSSFYFDEIKNRMVVYGKVSEEVFEAYLMLKNISWGDMKPLAETKKEQRREELLKKYPPQQIDETDK